MKKVTLIICLIAILLIAGCNLEQIYRQMYNTTMIEAEHPPRVPSPRMPNQVGEGHRPIPSTRRVDTENRKDEK